MTEDEMVGRHHRHDGLELKKLWEMVKDREPGLVQFMELQRAGYDLVTEQQQ